MFKAGAVFHLVRHSISECGGKSYSIVAWSYMPCTSHTHSIPIGRTYTSNFMRLSNTSIIIHDSSCKRHRTLITGIKPIGKIAIKTLYILCYQSEQLNVKYHENQQETVRYIWDKWLSTTENIAWCIHQVTRHITSHIWTISIHECQKRSLSPFT